MKKIILLATMFLCVYLSGYSQKWNGLKSDTPTMAKTTLVASSEDEVVVDVRLDGYYSATVSTPDGEQLVISGKDMAPMMIAGAPDLPTMPIPIIIGDNAEMQVDVIKSEYVDIEDVEVAPSKGNLSRKVNPNSVEYVYGEMYQQDAFYPSQQAALEDPYILRDFRGQNIMVYPYAYNPVSKTLRVYTHMTISAKKVSDNGVNRKVNKRRSGTSIDPEINEAYKRRFINYETSVKRDYFIVDEGEMLIVCVDDYMEELKPLVEWKNISGRPTKMVAVSETGTLDDLKNYLSDYYQENPELTFVLLVGEYNNLPPYSVGYNGKSDNYYGMYEGNDYYEEVLVGRLPVANVNDAKVQVGKIIHYERDINENDTWLSKGSGVGSDEGQGHNGEIDYEHIDFICDTLLNYTYTDMSKHYAYVNNPTASGMVNDFSQGLSIINYCNHGHPTGWSVADFDVSNVHQLTNDNKLPVIWSVACNNGQFNSSECFGEAWMRATNASTGSYTGGVGGMFSWIEQPWIPPMYGQDEMVAILTEWRPNYKHTLGGASLNGNMYILDVCPEDYGETHNTWLLFGDPSMMMRTKAPQSMGVTYSPSTLLIGMSSLTLNANTEFGIATLSIDGEAIASSYIQGGTTTLTFPALSEETTAKLVVMGYNKVTEIFELNVCPADGSYVVFDSYDVNEDDGQVDYGETINLSLSLKNVAKEAANNVNVEISTESQYVTINNSSATIASINAGEVVTIDNQLSFTVASDVPDMTNVRFEVKCTDGTETWQSSFMLDIHAPILVLNKVSLVDKIELLPGETATLRLLFDNIGSSAAHDVVTTFNSGSDDVTFGSSFLTTDVALPGETSEVTTEITMAESALMGTLYEVACKVSAGYYSFFSVYDLMAGFIKDDFETGDLSQYDWESAAPSWFVDNVGYEGQYCVRSPRDLGNNKSSVLTIRAEVFVDGKMSFYRKVSSEADYDFLKFYVDNKEIAVWSGELDWEIFELDVEAGEHIFKWKYEKDLSSKEGDDCAYIDYVVFPPVLKYEVSVVEVEKEGDEFSIYPNPTTGLINVDIDKRFDAVIYNYQGQVMMRLNDNDRQVDVSGLAAGLYLMEIRTDDDVTIKKILKR